jgi:signal transduction histidine kinase
MRSYCLLLAILLVTGTSTAIAQTPDLSRFPDDKKKVKAWIDYCESLRLNQQGSQSNYIRLQQDALKGLSISKSETPEDSSHFFFYAAFGYYFQVKFDSAQFYFYQSLYQGRKANSARLMENACVALIPVNFQLRQQDKVDSCKNVLQSILDTAHDKAILQDGYYAMGAYYQQKSYYSTAQDFYLKSIELRKAQVDTTTNQKLKADYAIQCYALSKQYQNTDLYDKGLSILQEGRRFSSIASTVDIRYLSSFSEIYCLLGNIDSALYYEKLLEERTKNSPTVPSEMVSANMNIAQYYMNHQAASKALPYVNLADTLAMRSKSPILIYQAQMVAGRYFEETGRFEQAIAQLSQSMRVAQQISKEQYADILKYMAIAEKGLGNSDAALQYYQQYVQQSDSLTKEKISRNFADQETRYQTNQKELRIAALGKENQLEALELENASRTRLLLILGLVALGVIALLLYFIYRNKEKLNKILNAQNEQLGDLNAQLAVANETKAKLFGIIGHDLRSPVSKIVQLLQLQNENPGSLSGEARQKHEEKLKTASENVLETMEDLLLWSKSQMLHFKPQFAKVSIRPLLQKEINLLHDQLEDKKLSVDMFAEDGLSKRTDENFIAVIFRNLLQNAVKYSDENTIISVEANEQKLSVSNRCTSIDADILNKRLNTADIDSKDSGLGLQIVRDLSGAIGAKISFQQENNQTLTAILNW